MDLFLIDIYFFSQYHQYQYFGTGLLSNYDKYPEHKKAVIGFRKIESSNFKRKVDKSLLDSAKSRKTKKSLKKESGLNDSFVCNAATFIKLNVIHTLIH